MLIRVDYFPCGYLISLVPSNERIVDLDLYTRVIWVNCWLRTVMQVFRSFHWGAPHSPEMSLLICCLEGEDLCVLGAEVVRRL